jgi:hypothetical protein
MKSNIDKDRKVLKHLVESYGKDDILNFLGISSIRSINTINESAGSFRSPVIRNRFNRPIVKRTVNESAGSFRFPVIRNRFNRPIVKRTVNESANTSRNLTKRRFVNEDDSAPRRVTSTIILAEVIAHAAGAHTPGEGGQLDISKTGFPTTYLKIWKTLKGEIYNMAKPIQDKLKDKLSALNNLSAFNDFITLPEVDEILTSYGVTFNKQNREYCNYTKLKEIAGRGKEAEQHLSDHFDIIYFNDFSWDDVIGGNGMIARRVEELIDRFPILINDDYFKMLLNSLAWVVRSNSQNDPVILVLANDDYVQQCIKGNIVPVQISAIINDLKVIFAKNLPNSKSATGESGYYAARACTFGHFLDHPVPTEEENLNAERDTDEEL